MANGTKVTASQMLTHLCFHLKHSILLCQNKVVEKKKTISIDGLDEES